MFYWLLHNVPILEFTFNIFENHCVSVSDYEFKIKGSYFKSKTYSGQWTVVTGFTNKQCEKHRSGSSTVHELLIYKYLFFIAYPLFPNIIITV